MGSLLNEEYINLVNDGHLVSIRPTEPVPLILAKNEVLLYVDKGYTEKTSTRTTGYKTKSKGVSIRVAKGVRFHLGGGKAKPKTTTSTVKTPGILYITSERVVWTSQSGAFDYRVPKITSVIPYRSSVAIQSGNKVHNICIPYPDVFSKVFSLLVERFVEDN